MDHDEATGRLTTKRGQLARLSLSHGKRTGCTPDEWATNEALEQTGVVLEEKLIQLLEAGWLKARPVSRLIGRQDKISALRKARRHPNDARYRVHRLSDHERELMRVWLAELANTLDAVLFFASRTPDNQAITQAEVRLVLRRPELDTINIRRGRTAREVARFWAFMRGHPARRADVEDMLSRLRPLLDLLR